jgi:hypothetical protein
MRIEVSTVKQDTSEGAGHTSVVELDNGRSFQAFCRVCNTDGLTRGYSGMASGQLDVKAARRKLKPWHVHINVTFALPPSPGRYRR